MTKKALVVGIDKYNNPQYELQGCTMDATVMSGVLQDHDGFPRDTIRMVLDDRATKANILERLDWLVRDNKPGDILTFFYAGHGSQVRDRDGDELEDGLDEILCPCDMNWDDPLTDDIIHSYLVRVPQGVTMVIVFDCCFSGTATRSLWAEVTEDKKIIGEPIYKKNRFIKPPIDIEYRSRGIDLKTRRIGEVATQENHILLSAATSYQEAQETRIDGQARGAFTYYLVDSLKKVNWQATYRQAHDETVMRLKDKGFVQIPQLEGPAASMDKPIFS
jgi:hypothetical protein